MSCITSIQRLYQPNAQCADHFIQPQRWCHRQWENLTTFQDSDCRHVVQIAALIVVFIPLTFATLVSYPIGGVGIALKACTSEPAAGLENTNGSSSRSNPVHRRVSGSPSSVQLTQAGNPSEPYDEASWPALRELVTVTDGETRSFVDYQFTSPIEPVASPVKSRAFAENIKFFYGNCDAHLSQGCQDLGWGCAWRSIQTCLSPFSVFHSFSSLYQAFKLNQDGISRERQWAEPGYGKRICDKMGIPSRLFLYNRARGTEKTPTDLCTQLESFKDFTDTLLAHFSQFRTPVMIDDEQLACSIIGIKLMENGHVILWIADPHKTTRKDGLYYLVLDAAGRKIHCTGIDDGTNGLRTAQVIDPNREGRCKGWMILLPGPGKAWTASTASSS